MLHCVAGGPITLDAGCRYFHAYRIDHILGFFRIWEIPGSCTAGLLGHFRPSVPIRLSELESRGIWDLERWASGRWQRHAWPARPPCCLRRSCKWGSVARGVVSVPPGTGCTPPLSWGGLISSKNGTGRLAPGACQKSAPGWAHHGMH